jgi:pyruvate/2-oxoglutarate dehydrogenase complex dihydrolipoamide dehydrogenase (E3) component
LAWARFKGVTGLYHKQDLELKMGSINKRAVIVGGGLIGIELAEIRSRYRCYISCT